MPKSKGMKPRQVDLRKWIPHQLSKPSQRIRNVAKLELEGHLVHDPMVRRGPVSERELNTEQFRNLAGSAPAASNSNCRP